MQHNAAAPLHRQRRRLERGVRGGGGDRYAIPAALYTVSDNCAVMVLSKIDPATFSLIWNCKTAVVAVLMRCVLVRKPFTWAKWVGIALLLVGPVLVEIGAKKGSLNKARPAPHPHHTQECSACAVNSRTLA